MGWLLRQVKPGDVPGLVRLAGQVQQQHAEYYPDAFKIPVDGGKVEKLFRRVIATADQDVLVAADESGVIGYLWYETQRRRGNVFKWASARLYVNHICVDGNRRGEGIGEALFTALDRIARHGGYDGITLDTWAANTRAHAFFERLGFSTLRLTMTKNLSEEERKAS
jgi:ribosomal protein S18 acetylase RimI-like enzyme